MQLSILRFIIKEIEPISWERHNPRITIFPQITHSASMYTSATILTFILDTIFGHALNGKIALMMLMNDSNCLSALLHNIKIL
jgi:hypothetical protein